MNGTHQVLAYVDDFNLIDDIITVGRTAEVSLNACKDVGLPVNIGKTKYMEVRRRRGLIANEHIAVGSNSYKTVKTFKYLFTEE